MYSDNSLGARGWWNKLSVRERKKAIEQAGFSDYFRTEDYRRNYDDQQGLFFAGRRRRGKIILAYADTLPKVKPRRRNGRPLPPSHDLLRRGGPGHRQF